MDPPLHGDETGAVQPGALARHESRFHCRVSHWIPGAELEAGEIAPRIVGEGLRHAGHLERFLDGVGQGVRPVYELSAVASAQP